MQGSWALLSPPRQAHPNHHTNSIHREHLHWFLMCIVKEVGVDRQSGKTVTSHTYVQVSPLFPGTNFVTRGQGSESSMWKGGRTLRGIAPRLAATIKTKG